MRKSYFMTARAVFVLVTVTIGTSITQAVPNKEEIQARYELAKKLEGAFYKETIYKNAHIQPNWIGESNRFWYIRHVDGGTRFRLADAKNATNKEAFNHVKLAKALAKISGKTVEATNLPIGNLNFTGRTVAFDAFGERWVFDGKTKVKKGVQIQQQHGLVSPNGTKEAFVKDHNIWLRNLETGKEEALTTDGQKYYTYGVQPEGRFLVTDHETLFHTPAPLEAIWSADGSKLFTVQTDERLVRVLPSVVYAPQDGSLAPRVVERKYSLPGDKNIVEYRMVVIDTATGKQINARYPRIEDSFIWHGPATGNRMWWSADGSKTYFLDMSRGQTSVQVVEMDALTGVTRALFTESADTYLEIGHNFEAPTDIIPVPATDELIWFSQRSGYAHMYLYDLKTGKLKNTITSGDWSVRDVTYFDAQNREVYAQLQGRVKGRDFYYREIARFNVDSGEMTLIASSDHDYDMYNDYGGTGGLSPNGEYVVSTHSRVNTVPVTDVRDRNGNVVMTLETANYSGLPKGWQWPEPVQTIAADGKTPIYGVVFRPTHFDPAKTYPVLSFAHGNPFYASVPKMANHGYVMTASAFAELGMIVVMMDGRGTSFRSKEFRDYGFDTFLENAGIVDHVAGLKQLAKRYPYMDLNRTGIMDFDGSNSGVLGLLRFPDFYKVGVASSLYDPRLVKQGEVYMGLTTEEKRSKAVVWGDSVQDLKGKLFISTGLRDEFFHPAATFHLTDALVKANKDFDHLVQPNGSHAWRLVNSRRRMWDYFTRHLIGAEPPTDFKLQSAFEASWGYQMTEK